MVRDAPNQSTAEPELRSTVHGKKHGLGLPPNRAYNAFELVWACPVPYLFWYGSGGEGI